MSIKISCDICGKPAEFGVWTEYYGTTLNPKSMENAKHHICRACADKIGIIPPKKPESEVTH